LKNYEALLIFLTTMKEDDTDRALTAVKGEIERLGGTAGESTYMGKRGFARPMKKQDEGFYHKLPFRLAPDRVEKLMGRLKLNQDVFRVQIEQAKAVKEAEPEPAEESAAAADAPVEAPAPEAAPAAAAAPVPEAAPAAEAAPVPEAGAEVPLG